MELYKSKYSDGKTDGRNSRRENKASRSFRNSRDDRGSRNDSRDASTTVTCSDCGTECTVPFIPRTSKPVYCSDCFRQNKPQDSGNDRHSRDDRGSRYSRDDRGSRYSRDDRGSRYSRDDRGSRSSSKRESNRNNSRFSKPRNDKFLRKQESFFSGGSDKFVETIKQKLYEILGGKICSNCGFKDERALGICPISENVTSDNSGRGGDVASWGKYISEPDRAREELKVFCLNCDQIREPSSKRKEVRTKPKKSKYFPR